MSLPKPCPFCGSDDVSIDSYSNGEIFFGCCRTCGANGPESWEETEAALAWNRRAGDEETNV
ncbi:Lar family restriction alleviation protein [Enterobacter hormaechei]|uniref:Lar family restriction alleviation protein n=1 Tax=Enterobacter hormaechei TaxID=158836 RepID=UPI001D08B05A|nr:Lar family restriction alleviation protein [Enterobacter hormaechei]